MQDDCIIFHFAPSNGSYLVITTDVRDALVLDKIKYINPPEYMQVVDQKWILSVSRVCHFLKYSQIWFTSSQSSMDWHI